MIEFCSIASGSNGNCYYVGNKNNAVLIDAGITRKLFKERAELRKLDYTKIKAIFISHEHGDHIKGVKPLARFLNVPVFITRSTFDKMWNPHRPGNYQLFTPGDSIQIEDLTIHCFSAKHDAADPASFRVETNGYSCGVITDLGVACDNTIEHVKECNALILESNYDEKMLWDGPYPWPLKKRVSSDLGHLSNDQAYLLVKKYGNKDLKVLLLGHVSKDNNSFEIIKEQFKTFEKRMTVSIATRFSATQKYTLEKVPVQQVLF